MVFEKLLNVFFHLESFVQMIFAAFTVEKTPTAETIRVKVVFFFFLSSDPCGLMKLTVASGES